MKQYHGYNSNVDDWMERVEVRVSLTKHGRELYEIGARDDFYKRADGHVGRIIRIERSPWGGYQVSVDAVGAGLVLGKSKNIPVINCVYVDEGEESRDLVASVVSGDIHRLYLQATGKLSEEGTYRDTQYYNLRAGG